jgi:hypothetical protein
MRTRHAVVLAMFVALLAGAALAQEPGEREPMPPAWDAHSGRSSGGSLFYGGYVGLAFGSGQYIELSPLVGYRFSPDFGAGVGLLYRYRKDNYYGQDVSLTDYGANAFARYYLGSGVFTQAEYDYTNYEYVPDSVSGASDRQSYSAFLAGVGYSTAVGQGAGVYALVLYDFNYSGSNQYNPYSSAVQFRVGVSIGF